MRLTHKFETVEMGDEIVAVPVDESANSLHGVLKLNKEGAEILEMLKDDISEETIINNLAIKYDNDYESLSQLVHTFIETLKTHDLIAE